MKSIFTLAFFSVMSILSIAQQPADTDATRRPLPAPIGTLTTTRETPARDPVMIKEGKKYYLFSTGNGLSVFSSTDMKNWRKEAPVFSNSPRWVTEALPGYRGSSMWAPDISFHDGKYYLYYSVSVFGKNTSCIGVAVNKTLDSASADFKWEDKGPVVQSVSGRDQWNAIDPNLVIDENGIPWLAFGSHWQGLKMVRLNTDLISIAKPEEWLTIASRPRDFGTPDSSAGNAAIEAPFIFKKNNLYYLFVSQDACCSAEKSTYKVAVGRSEKATGPFLDRNGVDMVRNGGTIIVQGDGKDWYAAGHNSVYTFDEADYLICHGYDAKDRGRAKLVIGKLTWKDGWPVFSKTD